MLVLSSPVFVTILGSKSPVVLFPPTIPKPDQFPPAISAVSAKMPSLPHKVPTGSIVGMAIGNRVMLISSKSLPQALLIV